MRKLAFLTTAAALAAVATPALAAPVTGTVNVSGSVAAKCKFVTASADLPLGELADADGGLDASKVDGQTRTLNGWCNNSAATLSVKATALTGDQAVTSGAETAFTDRVNYTASVAANAQTFTDSSTDDLASTATTVNMFSGDIVVTLGASTASSKKLVAGAYSGKVEVTLSPTV
ncbi:hypothetical protein [Novosphingobium taihuense]|uniref:Uncharacterized protein n=1 Tax=Novosphingobium taihuense TaxID=260085 RepID=A0A7W7AC53_9SPHN|nr:hypothetical protein [Novosphingobium taihuense]MBB4613560.1 hypothetical protein [Novosphingobium taihuense]TWH81196.1 hypothetical protein IQ25_03583 [Novosphingobium taihuense]